MEIYNGSVGNQNMSPKVTYTWFRIVDTSQTWYISLVCLGNVSYLDEI